MLTMKIKNSKVVFPDRNKYKIAYSDGVVKLVNALLTKDPKKRLGAKADVEEVLSHDYFKDLDMTALMRK